MDLFATAPIRPWDYIRLRREAAGLTIAQAARPHWHRPEHRETVERATARIEQPGVTIDHHLARDIRRSFPFDPAVYAALQEADARYHPRLCRSCGWDAHAPGQTRDGSAIRFVADDVDRCTACAEQERAGQPRSRRIAA